MENWEQRLENFKTNAEIALEKTLEDYGALYDMEVEYCNLINEGTAIRAYILQTHEICDRQSYLVLTNQVPNTDLLKGKFKPLAMIMDLSLKLFKEYSRLIEIHLKNKEYGKAIVLYEQIFNITKSTLYKRKIADILYKSLNNYEQAFEIYKSIENTRNDDIEFWKNYAEIQQHFGNTEMHHHCIIKYKELCAKDEIKKILDDKNYKKAIEKYEELFKLTNNFNYKKEIANINAICLNNINKAIKQYKNIEKYLGNDPNFWFQFSELYEFNANFYKEVLCIKKAIDIELSTKGDN